MTKEREAIYEGGSSLYGGYRLNISSADEDGAYLHVAEGSSSMCLCVSAEHLRALAAQCLEAADEVEAAQKPLDPEGDFVRDELKGNFKPVK